MGASEYQWRSTLGRSPRSGCRHRKMPPTTPRSMLGHENQQGHEVLGGLWSRGGVSCIGEAHGRRGTIGDGETTLPRGFAFEKSREMTFHWRLGGLNSGVLLMGETPVHRLLGDGGAGQARKGWTGASWFLLLPELGGRPHAKGRACSPTGHGAKGIRCPGPACSTQLRGECSLQAEGSHGRGTRPRQTGIPRGQGPWRGGGGA